MFFQNKKKKKLQKGWVYISVTECLQNVCEALGSSLSTVGKKQKCMVPIIQFGASMPSKKPSQDPKYTFLAVQALEAQGAVTLITLLPGLTAAPMGTGGPHTGVGRILHIHTRCKVVFHVDGPVIQDDLRVEKHKEMQDLGKTNLQFTNLSYI